MKVGDRVTLLKIPQSLIHDLPEAEQREMLSFIGKIAEVTEIDEFGFFWIGYGCQTDRGTFSDYSGHSFSVTTDCIQKVEE